MSMSLGPCPSLPFPLMRGDHLLEHPANAHGVLGKPDSTRDRGAGRTGPPRQGLALHRAHTGQPRWGSWVLRPPLGEGNWAKRLPAELIPIWNADVLLHPCESRVLRVGLRTPSFFCLGLDPAFSQGFPQSPWQRPHTPPQTQGGLGRSLLPECRGLPRGGSALHGEGG